MIVMLYMHPCMQNGTLSLRNRALGAVIVFLRRVLCHIFCCAVGPARCLRRMCPWGSRDASGKRETGWDHRVIDEGHKPAQNIPACETNIYEDIEHNIPKSPTVTWSDVLVCMCHTHVLKIEPLTLVINMLKRDSLVNFGGTHGD